MKTLIDYLACIILAAILVSLILVIGIVSLKETAIFCYVSGCILLIWSVERLTS